MGYSIATRIEDAATRTATYEALAQVWEDIQVRCFVGLGRGKRDVTDKLTEELGLTKYIGRYGTLRPGVFVSVRPAINDGPESSGLSYDHNPHAIGFDYGDHGLAWGCAMWLAATFNTSLYYDGGLVETAIPPIPPAAEDMRVSDAYLWYKWAEEYLGARVREVTL